MALATTKNDYLQDKYIANAKNVQPYSLRKNAPHLHHQLDNKYRGVSRSKLNNSPNTAQTFEIYKQAKLKQQLKKKKPKQ